MVVVDSLGSDAVLVTVPWRRHDKDPAAKSIVVVDAASDEPVANSMTLRVDNISGDVAFQPNPGSTTYHVYYMPWESTGGNYPRVTYPEPASHADASWEQRVRAAPPSSLPRARTTQIQSVNAFHSFFPMEVIASESETAAFMSNVPDGWALVPEHRNYPVRMRHFLPQHWTKREHATEFASRALRGEYFTFQLAVVAGMDAVDDVRVAFEGFPESWDQALTCFNCGGINELGRPFETDVSVPAGTVQALWIGIAIPEAERPGPYAGDVVVSTGARGSKRVRVSIDVQPGHAVDHSFATPELMTRLVWLNSTVGTDPDFIVEPYQPLSVDGRSLSILGRTVELGAGGLPDRLLSYFSPEMTHLTDVPQQVLARPIDLEILVAGRPEHFELAGYEVRQEARGRAHWSAESRSERVRIAVDGALEYDGMLDYRISVRALRDLEVDDIVLRVALQPDAAEYMLGLGYRGGKRPQSVGCLHEIDGLADDGRVSNDSPMSQPGLAHQIGVFGRSCDGSAVLPRNILVLFVVKHEQWYVEPGENSVGFGLFHRETQSGLDLSEGAL